MTDKFELCIIELPKAKRLYGEKAYNRLCDWMMFLDNPNSQEVQEIMKRSENIKDAYNKLKYLSKDEDIRRIAELKEKTRRDENGIRQFSIEQGYKQGMQQGAEQEKIDIAKNMLKKNMDIKTISEITKLTIEEIIKLKV